MTFNAMTEHYDRDHGLRKACAVHQHPHPEGYHSRIGMYAY